MCFSIKKIDKSLLVALCLFALITRSKAQGCSDAGFCTVGSFKHETFESGNKDSTRQKHRITLLAPIGVGDEDVVVFTPGLQYDYFASSSLSLQARVTANYADGNLGNAFGAGDIFLTASYTFPHKKKWYTQITAGEKIPLNLSTLKEGDRSLPMQYQSSLGTFDLIAGVTVSNNDWQFSTALQQPLSGKNRNNFLPVYWDKPEAMNYPPTNDFNRKGDVLLRVGKNFNLGNKLILNAGVLSIFHLGEDEYIDANISNDPIAIKGSDGVTVNITGAVWWQVNNRTRLGFTGGVPVVSRDVRPDGLTRNFVFAPEISLNF